MMRGAGMASNLPVGPFGVIYADPPWKNSAYKKSSRNSAQHYPVMPLKEIKAMPIADIAGANSWLFLWTTWPHLAQALDVMGVWGFKYSSNGFLWVKLQRRQAEALMFDRASFHMGTGLTTRKNTEVCLLGKRGHPGRLSGGVCELIISEVREYSRKPDDVRERIMQYADGPYLELFARTAAPGWAVWGNETGKFKAAI